MSLFETTSVSITKFDTPESDGFVADSDTSFREQIFNIAKTEVESMVEPDGIADDIGWESVPLVRIHRRIIDQRRLTCQYLDDRYRVAGMQLSEIYFDRRFPFRFLPPIVS